MTTKIIICHGVYDGVQFIAHDYYNNTINNYPLSSNYASKSMLVAGDGLKLVIDTQWNISYKLIKPVPRKHIQWVLFKEWHQYLALWSDQCRYKLNPAAVSYFKGKVWDSVSLIFNPWYISSDQTSYATIQSISHSLSHL